MKKLVFMAIRKEDLKVGWVGVDSVTIFEKLLKVIKERK